MFYVERDPGGGNWTTMLSSPHQIGVSDLQGPRTTDQYNFPPAVTPGNKSAFAGLPGWKARVRHNDTLMEEYVWDKVPINPHDPESDTYWGWKRVFVNEAGFSPDSPSGPMGFIG